ncbi:MAG: response regulator transcription factor [Chloroflexi bacterium]|nr:response regulator transcription factor [Chloroflexota bacterium]
MKKIKILVVDDHPVVRNGLVGMLNGQGSFNVVGEAENGIEALNLVEGLNPDVILMDLKMPEMNGVTAIRKIRKLRPAQHILVLTTYDSDSDLLPAIEAGATGYLLKDVPREDLFSAIEATARGETVVAPNIAARLFSKMRNPGEDKLTTREIEVLQRVAKGDTNKEAARSLHISEATIKTHLLHIFDKLGVDDRTAAVTEAIKRDIFRLD